MNIECEIVPELGGTALSPITTPSYHSIIWMLNTRGQVFLIHDVCYSYLAETPNACKEKVRELLDYMLTIEGEDEPRFVNIFLQ